MKEFISNLDDLKGLTIEGHSETSEDDFILRLSNGKALYLTSSSGYDGDSEVEHDATPCLSIGELYNYQLISADEMEFMQGKRDEERAKAAIESSKAEKTKRLRLYKELQQEFN